MPDSEPNTERNLDGYGAPAIQWTPVRAALQGALGNQAPATGGPDRHTAWLATVHPDGRPHVMPLGVLWIDGALYFNAGPGTRKAKNIAHDPRCVITLATHPFDVVIEGEAVKVTDADDLEGVAAVYRSSGWEPTVRDGSLYAEFSAPSAGPPPWDVYRVVPQTAFALGTAEPFGATRFDF